MVDSASDTQVQISAYYAPPILLLLVSVRPGLANVLLTKQARTR